MNAGGASGSNGASGVYTVMQNPDQHRAVTTADVVLPKKAVLTLSILLFLASVLAIILQVLLIVSNGDDEISSIGTGIWCGAFFALTAAIGIFSALKPSKCSVGLFLLMSILSVCLCVPMLFFSMWGVIENDSNNCNNSYDCYYGSRSNRVNVSSRSGARVWLVGGSSSNKGNVMAYNPSTGIEGPVCDDDWEMKDGLVVCKQLGYLRVSEVTTGSQFGSVSDYFSYDDVQCFGFESNLDNCAHSNSDNCHSSEGAGVVCTNDPGPVTLVGGTSLSEGNVMAVNPSSNITGPVCDDNWDINDANVVCRELGYIGAYSATTDSQFGDVSGPYSYGAVRCFGDEASLHSCPHLDYDSCNGHKGAGVICYTNTSMRVSLVGGMSASEGNVMAFNPSTGVIGPVCDHYWDANDASVVCRELGYIGAVSATTNSHFGDVSGTFSYSNVYCTGDEASLDICRNYYNSDCYESDGAGVICNTNPPTKVTLVGADSHLSGNVYATNPTTGVFGPVCDDSWDYNDAKVVCRQLGFAYVEATFSGSHFGVVSQPFSYNSVNCDGYESSLEYCLHSDHQDTYNCNTGSGAGVTCSNENPVNSFKFSLNIVQTTIALLVAVFAITTSALSCNALVSQKTIPNQQGIPLSTQMRPGMLMQAGLNPGIPLSSRPQVPQSPPIYESIQNS